MTKTNAPIKDDELEIDEKVLTPDLIAGEDGVEETEEEETLDDDDVDPFHDKWEE